MRADWRDVLLTLLGLSIAVTWVTVMGALILPFLSDVTVHFFPIAATVLVVFLFGLGLIMYLRLLQMIVPLKPGTYSLDHFMFTIWKQHGIWVNLARKCFFILDHNLTRVLMYRLLGCKVGKNVAIGDIFLPDPFLTKFEDSAIIGEGCLISGHFIKDGHVVLGEVRVQSGALVGVLSVLAPDVVISKGGQVRPLSFVFPHTVVGPDEIWAGNPAVKIKDK